jgi:hypothetical protein
VVAYFLSPLVRPRYLALQSLTSAWSLILSTLALLRLFSLNIVTTRHALKNIASVNENTAAQPSSSASLV